MALSYLLAPIPKWVLINNEGTVAGGGKLYTYRSLNKVQQKTVYQDPGGTIPWTNPILFDLNGVQGPFYWETNSSDLDDTYYLEAYDSNDNLLWTLDDYFPPGSGGGGNVTTYVPLLNYITNSVFVDHIPDQAGPLSTNLVVAPSNHKGFTPAENNPISATPYGVVGPDIRFCKNSAGTPATDNLTFPLFPLASAPLTGDVTPVDYVRYQCTNSPVGETFKYFQFPITQKVKNLSNQEMTFQIWAAVAATPVTINVYVMQYFGSGTAASAPVRDLVSSFTLTTTWTPYVDTIIIPDVAGKSLGTPGLQTDDDALYIQVEMPLNAPCDVFFTKPALYLGDIDPSADYQTYDQIDAVNLTPRTGDIRTTLSTTAPSGWAVMSDTSIGNVGSGATNLAQAYTYQLYKTLWDGVADAWAPVSGGRGATATADFLAGKTLTLPRSLGRAMANYGSGSGLTPRALGEYVGNETISIAAMPAHTHPGSTVGIQVNPINVVGGGTNSMSAGGSTAVSVASQGGSAADGNMPPTSFMNVFIKL